jgi:Flp pilus assembly protein TadD
MFDRTERLFSRGQRALSARDFRRALELLREAIETDPGYAHIYMYLGRAHAELGNLDEAIAAIGRAVKLAPTNFVFPLEHGIWLLDAGQAQPAKIRFQSTSPTTAGPFDMGGSGRPPSPPTSAATAEPPSRSTARSRLREL